MRNLILVLGDQLDRWSPVFDDFDPDRDRVWMAEVQDEATHVWCHQLRIALFFTAMRHFRDALTDRGLQVCYHQLTERRSDDRGDSFADVLAADVRRLNPDRLIMARPGDWRVLQQLQEAADTLGIELQVVDDGHFYCGIDEFAEYADGRKSLLLEYFYRHLRRKHNILLDPDGNPEGGQWNFDHDNRESFSTEGPGQLKSPRGFRPDDVTKEVIRLVKTRFADHPGQLDNFSLPVTRREARTFLREFIRHQLADFGRYEDAMWTEEPFLYHSRLSAPLNLKLLNPRECVDMAVDAWKSGHAPLNSVEGFVRQILGWREFIRGVYWLRMPEYAGQNALEQHAELPQFFWTGDTEMACVRDSMQHVLQHGYAHHIHRLMVLGNFALLWGANPIAFHEWHMAMYLDAIDWVSLPNTLGMSQYGDGGVVGTKPYCSSGNYINTMSNYCSKCRYNYRQRTGDEACPFTTLYWEFLDRQYDRLRDNRRMTFPIRNLERLRSDNPDELQAIRDRGDQLRSQWATGRPGDS